MKRGLKKQSKHFLKLRINEYIHTKDDWDDDEGQVDTCSGIVFDSYQCAQSKDHQRDVRDGGFGLPDDCGTMDKPTFAC